MQNLSKIDQLAADREIAMFMRGEIRLLSIPSWMLVGKRCKHKNMFGQCAEPVMTDGPYCFYHERFNRGHTDIQKETSAK